MLETIVPDPRWDERLRQLGDALINHPARTQWGRVVDFLRDSLGAQAVEAVNDGSVVAHTGHSDEHRSELSRGPALLLARLAAAEGAAVRVDDTRVGPFEAEKDGLQLHLLGYCSGLCVPLIHRGVQHGAIVLWFSEEFEDVEGEAVPANYILSAVRQLLTLSYERDSRAVGAEGALTSLGEVNRLASLGLAMDNSLFALRGPSSSMLIQIEELRRLADEMTLLTEPSDHALGDALGELSQTIDDITMAATLVRKELTNLSDISTNDGNDEHIQLSRLVHEAVVIARPELEQRGFVLQERVASESYLTGNRHEMLHLVLGLLFAWSQSEPVKKDRPVLEIQLSSDEHESRIRVVGRQSNAPTPPSPPGACVRIAQAHHGEFTCSPGVLEVTFKKKFKESEAPISTTPKIKNVLLIDDDALFARALRRALTPHDVKICASAADAKIALMEPDYNPDMVICDIWLPGTSGRDLHERIANELPELAPRFLFVSGAPISTTDALYFENVGCSSFAKPLQATELLSRLERDVPKKSEAVGAPPSSIPPQLA